MVVPGSRIRFQGDYLKGVMPRGARLIPKPGKLVHLQIDGERPQLHVVKLNRIRLNLENLFSWPILPATKIIIDLYKLAGDLTKGWYARTST